MEDFMTLMKRGVIYDGCPIVAKGTIRIKNGEISIDTMHNLMAVDGKSFAALCEGGKNEQGEVKEIDEVPEIYREKIEELTTQNEKVVEGLKKTIESLQQKLQNEYTLRDTFETRISEEATFKILELKSKLAEEAERVEALKAQLDSAGLLLTEKEEKLRETVLLLADRDARVKVHEMREKESLMIAESLREQIALLEDERKEEKSNSAALLEDFNEWRSNSDEEIQALKKELEESRSTIVTLKNELEVAELEASGYQQTIATLQKEIGSLKHEHDEHAAQAAPETPRKMRQTSIRGLMKGMMKSSKEKEERKVEKKNSFASAPQL
eukprot:Phypoly_transcript_12791.p1 GENE.Phypoly_transcript_12791~~Phypoly_transcript_12791.p1  ORF type:complete len:326 (+),score=77.94 Phypoly_transcript_12791:42-1019(+)